MTNETAPTPFRLPFDGLVAGIAGVAGLAAFIAFNALAAIPPCDFY
jgi:hypothetical protein